LEVGADASPGEKVFKWQCTLDWLVLTTEIFLDEIFRTVIFLLLPYAVMLAT
jgi:hypothetical protein